MQSLCAVIINGWTDDSPECLNKYKTYKDTLGLLDGVITKGDKILIPPTLRDECMQEAHTAHLGFEKTFSLARATVFWPEMSKDFRALCAACETCAEHGNQQKGEKLTPVPVPPCAWQTVGMDNFVFKGQNYLLLVDYLTKFPVVCTVNDLSSSVNMAMVKSVFSEYGISVKLIADRGSNFTSKEFIEFAVKWQFDLQFTSSEHHKANGQAERYVQIVKQILRKATLGP
jgi:hypothetical protein